jgi:hypothetical protein
VASAHDVMHALTVLADGLDQHGPPLDQLQAQALDAAGAAPTDPQQLAAVLRRRSALEDEIRAHVEALAALDRQVALAADDAVRVLTALLQEVGRVHWLGGITRVVVGYAGQQTGALAPAPVNATAAADGGISWPVDHLGDSPSCGDNAGAVEKTCSGLNGFSTGVGGLTAGVDALTGRVEDARQILADPAASAQERAWASRLLAGVDEYRGAARIVELGGRADYALLAGKAAPVAGGLLAGWSGYHGEIDKGQSTGVAVGVGVTQAVVDTGIGWGAVALGAEGGAIVGSAVPVVGTAVGAGVGAGLGALAAVFLSNQFNGWISEAWESAAGDPSPPVSMASDQGR